MTEYENLICTRAWGYYQEGDVAKVIGLDAWGNPILEKQSDTGLGVPNWPLYFRRGEVYTPPEPPKIEINTIKAGTLLTISTGAWSDYHVHGVFRVLKDITQDDYEQFRLNDENEYDLHMCIAKMFRSGYIEDVPSVELHLGDGSDLDPMIRRV